MVNLLVIPAGEVEWIFRALFVFFLLLALLSFFYPERYRNWNLRLFERYRWVASPRLHERMRTASLARLRIQSGVIVLFMALVLLFSLKAPH